MVALHLMPPEVLTYLFEFLDSASIIAVSESCTKFNAIISQERLTRKLTLYLKYPMDIKGFSDVINRTTRRYRNLHIVRSRDRVTDHNDPANSTRVFRKLGEMIKDLRIDWSNAIRTRDASIFEIASRRRGHFMGRGRAIGGVRDLENLEEGIAAQALQTARDDIFNEFVYIIRHFTNIRSLFLFNVHLEKARQPADATMSFVNLKQLEMKQCDSYCFDLLTSCTALRKLDVADPWWNARVPGIENFETFLLSQTELKELDLKNFSYPRLFQVDRNNDIRFKLRSIVLKSVYFADKGIANNFFKTQDQLEEIDFQLHNEKIRCLDEMSWYNDMLKTIVTNKNLKSITIAKNRYKIDNCDFIANLLNKNVKKLSYTCTSEDKSDLFKTFIKMFPNLEDVAYKAEESEDTENGICFEEGTVLEKVQRLSITNSSVKSLLNLNSPSLQYLEYVPGKTGEYIDDLFGKFFHQHRQIKCLSIGNKSEVSYFFVSYNLCQIIINFLTQLEALTIYNFGEVNKSVKLLCNLLRLKSLKLSADDYQQFTAKTKVECHRSGLKLIPYKIPRAQTEIPSFVL